MCTEVFGRSCVYPWVVEMPALLPNALGGEAYLACPWLPELEECLYACMYTDKFQSARTLCALKLVV